MEALGGQGQGAGDYAAKKKIFEKKPTKKNQSFPIVMVMGERGRACIFFFLKFSS